MSYPIRAQLITNNRATQVHKPPRAEDWLKPKGEVCHSTDTRGATAQNIRDYFQNHPTAQASAHRVIDWNEIIQMIPENEISWHAGWTANHMYLSTELCEPADNDPDRMKKFQQVWDRAVWAFAYDCVRYGWTTGPDIWSHNGISKRYPKETNHTDPYGYFQRYGRTWQQFLAAIDSEIARQKAPKPPEVINLPVIQAQIADLTKQVSDLTAQGKAKDAQITTLENKLNQIKALVG